MKKVEKIVNFNRILRAVFVAFNKSKEIEKKRLLFKTESLIILFVFSEWFIRSDTENISKHL